MIIEFNTCFVDNFDLGRANYLKEKMRHVWWKGKVTHPPSVRENLYLSLRKSLHRQYIYYLVSMRLKYHYEFMGWDGLLLLNILHNNISKIADYAFLNLNQLRELGDISNNAIVNLPVHVFQGLIF